MNRRSGRHRIDESLRDDFVPARFPGQPPVENRPRDLAAMEAPLQEACVEYPTFVNRGVMAGEAGGRIPMARRFPNPELSQCQRAPNDLWPGNHWRGGRGGNHLARRESADADRSSGRSVDGRGRAEIGRSHLGFPMGSEHRALRRRPTALVGPGPLQEEPDSSLPAGSGNVFCSRTTSTPASSPALSTGGMTRPMGSGAHRTPTHAVIWKIGRAHNRSVFCPIGRGVFHPRPTLIPQRFGTIPNETREAPA